MKIIASDFDGTLSRGGVAREDIVAMEHWRAAGNLFGVVTGRMYNGSAAILQAGLPLDFLVGSNGSVLYSSDCRIINQVSMETSMLMPLYALAKEMNAIHFVVGKDDREIRIRYDQPDHQSALDEMKNLEVIEHFTAYFPTAEGADVFQNHIRTHFGHICNPMRNGNAVDVPPFGVDKPAGIRRYVELMGLSPETIITVGDNYNDIPMITAFTGYAVSNAVPEAKTAAYGVVDSVGALIEKYL